MKPVLVILAAGASSRLGTCKALVSITPKCPLELLLEAGACFDDGLPLVVTGADHAAIARAAPVQVEVALNARWALGRTGGIQIVRALRPGRDLCLAPVDVPLVPSGVFQGLLDAWRSAGSPPRGWLAPRTRAGAFGHPLVLGRELLDDLSDFAPDEPLRALREHAQPLMMLDVGTEAIVDDLDTPDDLARLRAMSTNPRDGRRVR